VNTDAGKSQVPPPDPASPPSQPTKPRGEGNMPPIVQTRTTRIVVADKWVFISRE
jgi:hypothetical protein